MAGALVARDERQRRLGRPIAAHRVEVGVAHAGRRQPDDDLAGPRLGHGELVDGQRLAEGVNDRGAHCLSHLGPLLC